MRGNEKSTRTALTIAHNFDKSYALFLQKKHEYGMINRQRKEAIVCLRTDEREGEKP